MGRLVPRVDLCTGHKCTFVSTHSSRWKAWRHKRKLKRKIRKNNLNKKVIIWKEWNVPHSAYHCQWWYSLYTYNEEK